VLSSASVQESTDSPSPSGIRSMMRLGNEWAKRAKCAGNWETMFAEDATDAKAICEGCPVRRQCLMFALDGDISSGVWGGEDFEERTRTCPICLKPKEPEALGCNSVHSLERLARLVELQAEGDTTISVSGRSVPTAPTAPGCLVPRGRSHSTAKAYKDGCRCDAALAALMAERVASGFNEKRRLPRREREEITAIQRFMALVEVDYDEHWWWKGSVNGGGYGNFWNGHQVVRAHRWAYETFVGPIRAGVAVRLNEKRGERQCVNPSHHKVRA